MKLKGNAANSNRFLNGITAASLGGLKAQWGRNIGKYREWKRLP